MGLLAKTYAAPNFILDGYIGTGRFCEFIYEFVEQKKQDDQWEFFLHKVWDKTYQEFKDAVENTQKQTDMTDDAIEAALKNTSRILGNFHPENEGGES